VTIGFLPIQIGDNEKTIGPADKISLSIVPEKPDRFFHDLFLFSGRTSAGVDDYFPLAYEHACQHQGKAQDGPGSKGLVEKDDPP
jgi:hypothetical protein